MSADDGTERFWWYEAMNCPDKNSTCLTMWQWIHIAALIPATFSIIASIFIIVTGIKYHRILSNLTFGAKLPIFISFCDLGWEIFHSGDHIHNLIQGYVTEDFWCILCGCMKPFSIKLCFYIHYLHSLSILITKSSPYYQYVFLYQIIYKISCQTAWTIAVSVYLNRSIFDDSCTEPKFGPHNIYLHAFCWGIPTIILISGFIFNVYGIEGPWCGIKDPMTDVYMVDIWMIIAILVLIVNYGWIMYKLHKVTTHHNNRKDSNSAVIVANNRIKRIIKTIGLYPVAYFVQWLAYCLYKTNVVPRTFETALWVVTTGINYIKFYKIM